MMAKILNIAGENFNTFQFQYFWYEHFQFLYFSVRSPDWKASHSPSRSWPGPPLSLQPLPTTLSWENFASFSFSVLHQVHEVHWLQQVHLVNQVPGAQRMVYQVTSWAVTHSTLTCGCTCNWSHLRLHLLDAGAQRYVITWSVAHLVKQEVYPPPSSHLKPWLSPKFTGFRQREGLQN